MRKFTLLSIAVICINSVSFSQINKGSVLLGGNINFGFGKTEVRSNVVPNISANYKNHAFLISPSFGIATKENTIAGFGLSYGNSEYNNEAQSSNTIGGNVYLRKYISLANNFYLFGQANLYYNHTKQENYNGSGDANNYKISGVGLNFYPGLSYAVNKKIHLEAGINSLLNLGYSIQENETIYSGNATKTTNKGITFDANASAASPFTFGIRFLLSK